MVLSNLSSFQFGIKGAMRLAVALMAWALILTSGSFGQSPVAGAMNKRKDALNDLKASIQGEASAKGRTESSRIRTTSDGYLKFIGTPPRNYMTVDQTQRGNPDSVAKSFLKQRRILLANDTPSIDFALKNKKAGNKQTFLKFEETYEKLKVFGAEVIVQTNDKGGVDCLVSDYHARHAGPRQRKDFSSAGHTEIGCRAECNTIAGRGA